MATSCGSSLSCAGIAAAGVASLYWGMEYRHKQGVRRAVLKKAESKRAERDALRKKALESGLGWDSLVTWVSANVQEGVQPPNAVVNASAQELLASMEAGTLSSEYIVRCFIARAIHIGEELGTNAEENFDEAIKEAQACDAERKAGICRGLLHGLPISVKDQFDQGGFDSTCGLSARCYRPKDRDGLLLSLVREQGAIPFVRTNVPQCLMLPETFNAIWGTASNPHDPLRTVGGSSGGEGGLIAARGSPLGLGTDIGGSVRIPASMCGIVGFKPTVGRLSAKGLAVPRLNDLNGQNAIRGSAGPMGRRVDDLALLMSAWCRKRAYEEDMSIPSLPWDVGAYEDAKASKRMRVGYFVNDGFFDPCPAAQRAVLETAATLRKAGHDVVEFPVDFKEAALLYVSLLASDGNLHGFVESLEGEALHPYYSFLHKVSNMPLVVRRIAILATRYLLKQPRMAGLLEAGKKKSTREFWGCVGIRDSLRKQLLEQFREAKLDVLLTPALALPAIPHGTSVKLNQACSYTFVWNNFDFPAGVVPVTRVHAAEEVYTSTYNDDITTQAAKACLSTAGLPVAVQVVAPPWREELCLGAMHIVEKLMEFDDQVPNHPPLSWHSKL